MSKFILVFLMGFLMSEALLWVGFHAGRWYERRHPNIKDKGGKMEEDYTHQGGTHLPKGA